MGGNLPHNWIILNKQNVPVLIIFFFGKRFEVLHRFIRIAGKGGGGEPKNSGFTAKAPSMPLHEAVLTGNEKAVKRHIDANSDLSEKDAFGSTALHAAAALGKTEIAALLIAAGVDVNAKDAYGSTPLNVAATFGNTAIAKSLIEGGADLGAVSGDGSTALHTAAFFGRTEIVRALLDAGVELNIKNNYGATPLANVSAPFDQMKPIYDQVSKDLGPLGLKLDYDELKAARPVIAQMLKDYAHER